jgi:pantoate--beta-alanine ligase
MLADAGCDLMFMPDSAEIYARGLERSARVEVPELSRILEGEFRPGHFEGVSTVVTKLFNIVEPSIAVFGEKDYQQLTIIRRMVEDLCMPVTIVPAPTVRESDGLALSSRNQYLSAAERQIAPRIYQELSLAAERLKSGETDIAGLERRASAALDAAGLRPDYFAVRARDLALPDAATRELVILAAVRLGRARLIDNIQVTR